MWLALGMCWIVGSRYPHHHHRHSRWQPIDGVAHCWSDCDEWVRFGADAAVPASAVDGDNFHGLMVYEMASRDGIWKYCEIWKKIIAISINMFAH